MRLFYGAVITRALTVGAAVGIVLGVYMLAVVEPVIDRAIDLEESLAAEDAAAEEEAAGDDAAEAAAAEPLVTRTQQVGGGVAANVIFALIVAAVYGTVFAATRHRLPGGDDFVKALWLAAVAFGTTALMPGIAYPASPPAVGDPDTVNERTLQYLACIAISVAAAWALTRVAGLLRSRLDQPTRIVAAVALTIATYGLLLVLLPDSPDSIAPEVPAGLVWDFRIRSIGSLALLWTGLGLGLGWLLQRDASPAPLPLDVGPGSAPGAATLNEGEPAGSGG